MTIILGTLKRVEYYVYKEINVTVCYVCFIEILVRDVTLNFN